MYDSLKSVASSFKTKNLDEFLANLIIKLRKHQYKILGMRKRYNRDMDILAL